MIGPERSNSAPGLYVQNKQLPRHEQTASGRSGVLVAEGDGAFDAVNCQREPRGNFGLLAGSRLRELIFRQVGYDPTGAKKVREVAMSGSR